MIEPTVGRVVWYHPSAEELTHGLVVLGDKLAAHIAHVHDSAHVNLLVIDSLGNPHSRRSVYLDQNEPVGQQSGAWCEWMPYQKGQAAKAEQLEKQLGTTAPAPAQPAA